MRYCGSVSKYQDEFVRSMPMDDESQRTSSVEMVNGAFQGLQILSHTVRSLRCLSKVPSIFPSKLYRVAAIFGLDKKSPPGSSAFRL